MLWQCFLVADGVAALRQICARQKKNFTVRTSLEKIVKNNVPCTIVYTYKKHSKFVFGERSHKGLQSLAIYIFGSDNIE